LKCKQNTDSVKTKRNGNEFELNDYLNLTTMVGTWNFEIGMDRFEMNRNKKAQR